jgi:division protein CdvB (Snf7/Vps24/ESCRT-III family)
MAAIIWRQSRERAQLLERLDEAHLRTSENVERMQAIINRLTPPDSCD